MERSWDGLLKPNCAASASNKEHLQWHAPLPGAQYSRRDRTETRSAPPGAATGTENQTFAVQGRCFISVSMFVRACKSNHIASINPTGEEKCSSPG